jgi:hypothetical protein
MRSVCARGAAGTTVAANAGGSLRRSFVPWTVSLGARPWQTLVSAEPVLVYTAPPIYRRSTRIQT